MNQGNFSGYLGHDASLRNTPNGNTVLNFSVAVRTGWGDNEKTLWVSCSMWGERGEKLQPYLLKGTPVSVSGDIDVRQWEGRDNQVHAEVTLNVQRLTLMGRASDRPDGGDAAAEPRRRAASPQQSGKPTPATAAAGAAAQPDFDDEIPF